MKIFINIKYDSENTNSPGELLLTSGGDSETVLLSFPDRFDARTLEVNTQELLNAIRAFNS